MHSGQASRRGWLPAALALDPILEASRLRSAEAEASVWQQWRGSQWQFPEQQSGPDDPIWEASRHWSAVAEAPVWQPWWGSPCQSPSAQSGSNPESLTDWIEQQDKFFGQLRKLPANWIRICSRPKGTVYFYNTESGESAQSEPAAVDFDGGALQGPPHDAWDEAVGKDEGDPDVDADAPREDEREEERSSAAPSVTLVEGGDDVYPDTYGPWRVCCRCQEPIGDLDDDGLDNDYGGICSSCLDAAEEAEG
jgi:hypothetical protein